MCSLDLEPCAVWRETPRKARKLHECDGCGATISAGDPYLDHFSVFDGNVCTEKMCGPCWFARQEFADAHGQSVPPSSLTEHLWECIGENDDDDDVWRSILAGILSRYRKSPSGSMAKRFARRIENEFESGADRTRYPENLIRPRHFVWPGGVG